jgi:predicted ATPase
MIKSISIENFFGFGNEPTVIQLNQGVNVLVGINGSGKSVFLKAVHLLFESIVGEGFEKLFLKEWGGFPSVANFGEKQSNTICISYEFDKEQILKILGNQSFPFQQNPVYEVIIHGSGSMSYFLEEKFYAGEFVFLQMRNGNGLISARENGNIRLQKYSQENNELSFKTHELVLRQISDPDKFYPIFTIKQAIENCIVYDYFDSSRLSKIRQPAAFGVEKKLLSNGENLAQILNRLKNQHSLHYEKIQDLIKKINPHFLDIGFDLLGALMYLVLREKKLNKTVSTKHISDGTLRYILLLSILLNPEKGFLIGLDEPEIGLHPDMLNTVAEAIKEAAKNSQIIIATHSPLLLNAFDLEDIIIFEKNQDNQIVVSVKREEDFEDWEGNFLAGQMWLRGKLGGKRW